MEFHGFLSFAVFSCSLHSILLFLTTVGRPSDQ